MKNKKTSFIIKTKSKFKKQYHEINYIHLFRLLFHLLYKNIKVHLFHFANEQKLFHVLLKYQLPLKQKDDLQYEQVFRQLENTFLHYIFGLILPKKHLQHFRRHLLFCFCGRTSVFNCK